MDRTRIIILAILAVIFLGIAIYFTFIQIPFCQNYACFQENMRKCSPAKYISEDPEATWKYEIKGLNGEACVINVVLIQPKQGELGLEQLNGFGMDCYYPKGVSTYPEKDLEKCNGRLKEELQAIIIKKLHTYIVENLGQVEQGLESFR